MPYSEASRYVRGSLSAIVGGFIFQLVGFASAFWQSVIIGGIIFHAGLWSSSENVTLPSWFKATQAFEILGFIAAFAALVLIDLYIFVPQTSGKRIVFILCMLACYVAAGCIIIGIIIYGAKVKENLDISYALCTVAGILFCISGILLTIDMLKR